MTKESCVTYSPAADGQFFTVPQAAMYDLVTGVSGGKLGPQLC